MSQNKTVIFVIISSILVINEYAFSQRNNIPEDTSEFINQFVLVREPDFVENCNENVKSNGVLVFPNKIPQVTRGAKYNVLTHMGEIVLASVGKIVLNDSCLYFEDSEISFGLLEAKSIFGWFGDVDAMVAVQSSLMQSNRAGKILSFQRQKTLPECLSIINQSIPDTEECDVTRSLSIITPDNKEYYFLAINQYSKSNLYQAGDAALFPIGFLFYIKHGKPQLLYREEYLTNIFTISDFNNDHEYEILTYSGSYAGGAYEIRTFNGKTFTKKKYLYGWDD